MDNKGQVGLDTAKAVMLALLVLGVLAFIAIIVMGSLADSDVSSTTGSGSVQNEVLTTVSEQGENLAVSGYADVVCTIQNVVNVTSGTTIGSDNYTQTNCALDSRNASGVGSPFFNNTNWNVNYTFTYDRFEDIDNNLSNASVGFFSNTSTWLALISIVVIILIVAIVIFAVNRFGNRNL